MFMCMLIWQSGITGSVISLYIVGGVVWIATRRWYLCSIPTITGRGIVTWKMAHISMTEHQPVSIDGVVTIYISQPLMYVVSFVIFAHGMKAVSWSKLQDFTVLWSSWLNLENDTYCFIVKQAGLTDVPRRSRNIQKKLGSFWMPDKPQRDGVTMQQCYNVTPWQ